MLNKNEALHILRNIKDTLYERGEEIEVSKDTTNNLQEVINKIEELYDLLEQTKDTVETAEENLKLDSCLSDRVKEFFQNRTK